MSDADDSAWLLEPVKPRWLTTSDIVSAIAVIEDGIGYPRSLLFRKRDLRRHQDLLAQLRAELAVRAAE